MARVKERNSFGVYAMGLRCFGQSMLRFRDQCLCSFATRCLDKLPPKGISSEYEKCCCVGTMIHQSLSRIYSGGVPRPLKRCMGVALTLLLGIGCVIWLGGCAVFSTYKEVTDFNTVVIDAGHGGHDSGTASRGLRNRVLEKDLALDVARRLEPKLRAAGFRTIMTRRTDEFITLDDRADASNSYRKSVFVSIHFNDALRRSVHGMEVYHNAKGTYGLARRIERALVSLPGGTYRGVKTARFRVLRKSDGPAVLVECGFLSNRDEATRCASAVYRDQLASRIAQGIIQQRQR